jgi:hypothetical protein
MTHYKNLSNESTPASTILITPATYKPLDYGEENNTFFLNGEKGFAPF